jgi:small subunit ribosomal protein S1
MSMAALLEEETIPYPRLRRGEIIEGVLVGTNRDGILVDIGAKSEGVVPPHEMHCLRPEGPSSLQPGEKLLVFVVQPESPEGQIILSLDRARGERGWRVLQDYMDQNISFEGHVAGSNKGGLLVNVEGVNAFVPLSQIVARPDRNSTEGPERALAGWVGKTLLFKVIELNRRRNRAILSERAAFQEKRAAEKERLLQEIKEGEVRSGRITSIRDFGIFVDLGGADGLVHLSELSWERTPKSPHELFEAGDEVEVYVLKVDQESKRIALSVRRAQPERWLEIVSQYREGQIVPGQVTKLAPFGAFVRLEGPIEGLVHISELVDRRVNHPNEVINEGDAVPVKIVRIEHDRHRLGLSLRQARDKAEEDGWTFNDNGSVVSPAPGVLAQLGIEETVTAPTTEAEPEPEAQTSAQPTAEIEAEAAIQIESEAPAAVEVAAEPETAAEEAQPSTAIASEVQTETTAEEPQAEAPPVEAAEETPSEEPAPEAAVATVPEGSAEAEPEAAAEPEATGEAPPVAAAEDTAPNEPAPEVATAPEGSAEAETETPTPIQNSEEQNATEQQPEAFNKEGETLTTSESAPVEPILSSQTQAERESGS